MKNQFHVGDNLEVMGKIEENSIDLVFFSPPYPGLAGCEMGVWAWFTFIRIRIAKIVRLLKKNGVLAMNVRPFPRVNGWFDARFFLIPALLFLRSLNIIDVYVWYNTNAAPAGAMKRNDIPAWELIFVTTKAKRVSGYKFFPTYHPYSEKTLNKLKDGNSTRSSDVRGSLTRGHSIVAQEGARDNNVLAISSSGDQNRPRAQGGSFPSDLAKAMIERFTEPGDVVLDPFCGVGTTCKMAQSMNRRWIGIDINPAEIEKAKGWLEETQLMLRIM